MLFKLLASANNRLSIKSRVPFMPDILSSGQQIKWRWECSITTSLLIMGFEMESSPIFIIRGAISLRSQINSLSHHVFIIMLTCSTELFHMVGVICVTGSFHISTAFASRPTFGIKSFGNSPNKFYGVENAVIWWQSQNFVPTICS
jgi:hypothetical protein